MPQNSPENVQITVLVPLDPGIHAKLWLVLRSWIYCLQFSFSLECLPDYLTRCEMLSVAWCPVRDRVCSCVFVRTFILGSSYVLCCEYSLSPFCSHSLSLHGVGCRTWSAANLFDFLWCSLSLSLNSIFLLPVRRIGARDGTPQVKTLRTDGNTS